MSDQSTFPTVFISYRREDTQGAADRLYDHLTEQLGDERVFMDIDSIPLGVDFEDVLREKLSSCQVVLPLIGQLWADVRDESGKRRIDDEHDYLRMEVESALARSDVQVIPVLVYGALMPRADQLPPALVPLCKRQALELHRTYFQASVDRLVYQLGRIAEAQRILQPPHVASPRKVDMSPPEVVESASQVTRTTEHSTASTASLPIDRPVSGESPLAIHLPVTDPAGEPAKPLPRDTPTPITDVRPEPVDARRENVAGPLPAVVTPVQTHVDPAPSEHAPHRVRARIYLYLCGYFIAHAILWFPLYWLWVVAGGNFNATPPVPILIFVVVDPAFWIAFSALSLFVSTDIGATAGVFCIVVAALDAVLALVLLLLARRSARGPLAPYLPHFTEKPGS
jgi:hypothetical protein